METNMISIIVPIYNVEKYLDKCIKSIVNQTYRNLQIILVNDGSTDNSKKICEKWAKEDSRIIVINKKNGGLSDARNKGIDKAIGKYIGFVDSDDFISKDMYQKLITAIENENADIAICGFEYVNENGIQIHRYIKKTKNQIISKYNAMEKLMSGGEVNFVPVWNKLYSKKIFGNIRFPVGRINEDEFVMHQIYNSANKIIVLKDIGYFYVQRENSIMSNKITPKRLDVIQAFSERYYFYIDNNLNDLAKKMMGEFQYTYYSIRGRLFKLFCNKADKKRISEIDKMYRKIYFKENDSREIELYLKAYCPHLIYCVKKIRVLNNLIKYAIRTRLAKCVFIDIANEKLDNKRFIKKKILNYQINGKTLDNKEQLYSKVTPNKKNIFLYVNQKISEDDVERLKRIIEAFKEQRINIFLKTIFFDTSTEIRNIYLEQLQQIYLSYLNLTIYVGEQSSYEFVKKYFPKENCVLVSDFNMLFDFQKSNCKL